MDITIVLCDSSSQDCYYSKCKKCPGTKNLEKYLANIIASKGTELISYNQWVTTKETKALRLL